MKKEEIKKLIAQMTLEEKAAICSGADFWHTTAVERLDIPSIMVSDGPHGLRTQKSEDSDHLGLNAAIKAVCFPAGCGAASSFDRELIREMGETLGKECQAEDVQVILGPAVCIKRSPLCGRNFEYMSEDPFVAGEMSAAYINGVQSQNVGTSIKHFAANNQEHERMNSSSDADERTLREIYLAAFETAVKKSSPWTIMCSYNKINGTYASEDPWLLTEVLRKDWGYDGLVMSDWGAVADRVKGVAAGMDLEMPGSNHINDAVIVEAVQNGSLSMEALDTTTERLLELVFKSVEGKAEEIFDREKDHAISAKIAASTMVLLKNEAFGDDDKKILPLSAEERVAFIGEFAEKPRYQGGGSSHINSYKVESALSLAEQYGSISYAKGFSAVEDVKDEALYEEAVKTAEQADKIVVFAGLPDSFESEGYDRKHMGLPTCQNELIKRLVSLGKPVAVVLHNGSPVEMPWVNKVSGILEAYLGGEAAGKAVMELLYGKENPSAKLAETFPIKLSDNPSYLSYGGMNKHAVYTEGVFVGYRYYDTKEMEVLFPFGHGLSYTTFEYSNLKVNREIMRAGETLTVSVDVKNTGDRVGREVVQLYVSDKTGYAIRPVKELKGFESVTLNPGETKTVAMVLDDRAFSYYEEEIHDWYAPNGTYEILIGKSSRDIVLKQEVSFEGSKKVMPVIDENIMMGDLTDWEVTRPFVKEKLSQYVNAFTGENSNEEFDALIEQMTHYMPLRSFRSFAGLSNEKLQELVEELKELVRREIEK